LTSQAPSTRKTWTFGSDPVEGHEDDQKAAAPVLLGKAERVGVVHPGEERAPRRPYSSLSVPEGGL